MVSDHLSEEEIQSVAIREELVGESRKHLEGCVACQRKVATYISLFTAIHEQPVTSFDMNIEEAVMAKLLHAEHQPRHRPLHDYLPIFIAVGFAVILIWIYRTWLTTYFQQISMVAIYVIVITVITLLIYVYADMLSTHRKKMNALDIE